jgi:hypothetical protein
VLEVARSAADAAWWTAYATIALAALAVETVVMAVAAYKSQDRQLRILEDQAKEQHAVNIRQIEVLDRQITELQEAPKIREREAEERRQAAEREAETRLQAEERQAAERRRAEQRQAEVERRQAVILARAQAEKVFLEEDRLDHNPAVTQAQHASGAASGPVITARVRNDSDQPVYDLVLSWHKGSAPWGEFERRATLMPGKEWLSSTRTLPDDLPAYVNPEVYGAVVWFRDAYGLRWRRRPDGVLDEIPPGQPLPLPALSRRLRCAEQRARQVRVQVAR